MNRDDILYCIQDYCDRYEIPISADQVAEAAETIAENIADREEYNYRCGIYSVDVNLILDSYFDDFETEE